MVGDVTGDEQDVRRRRQGAHVPDHLSGPVDGLRPSADVEIADVGDGEHERRLEVTAWGDNGNGRARGRVHVIESSIT